MPLVAMFVAMEVESLSMNAVSIPHVKQFIQSLEKSKLNKILQNVLALSTSEEISDYLTNALSLD